MKFIFPDSVNPSYRVMKVDAGYEIIINAIHSFKFYDNLNYFAENKKNFIDAGPWEYFEKYDIEGVFDEGLLKPRAEFLLYGCAFSSNSNISEQVSVSASVGNRRKELLVSGNRTINSFGLMSKKTPFYSIALTPSNAYGGIGFSANEKGKGADSLEGIDGEKYWPVPNITYPNQAMISRTDKLDPAGFWALPPNAPQRTKYLGEFDDQWLKTRWPELPEGTVHLYYQTAPFDQQFDNYFNGDEPIRIANMSPDFPVIETQLPGVRARIFLEQLSDGTKVFKELKTNADTLWLFPEYLKGYLAFRGKISVANRDADDITTVFCILENVNEPPASFENCYSNYLKEVHSESNKEEIEEHSDKSYQIAVQDDIVPEVALNYRAGMPESIQLRSVNFEKEMSDWSQIEMNKTNVTTEQLENFMNKSEPQGQGSLLDLKKVIKKANQDTLDVFKKVGVTENDLIAMLKESPDASNLVEEITQAGGLSGMLEQFERSIDSLFELEKKIANPDTRGPEDVALVHQMQKDELKKLSAAETEFEEPVEVKPIYDRDWVVAHHAAGKSFRGYELERLDLSGLNLSGADFSGAVLNKTDLTEGVLSGARFDDALLSEVIFNRANLAESSFRRVSASGSEFHEAQLQKANLRDGDFTASIFSGADLSQAILSGAICSGGNFADITANRIVADKAEMSDVNLTNAKLSEARLTHTSLVGASLKGSTLFRANCLRADFSGADASDCDFRECMLQDSQADAKTTFSRSNFTKAILNEISWDAPTVNQANFNEAQMDGADMTGARMLNVSMINVIARGAVFDKTDLENSDLSGSDMFEASFCDANLNATRLQNGNYFAVDFKGTKYEGASFEGSNIERTILKIRQQ